MKRRQFLRLIAGSGLGLSSCAYWPDKRLFNPCFDNIEQSGLLDHALVLRAWEGINPEKFRDCHVHLIGTGDSESGIWVNPEMTSLFHLIKYTQFKFYLNASCVKDNSSNDNEYIERLLELVGVFPARAKIMLLAFDYYHNRHGQIVKDLSTFSTPNKYAAKIAEKHPHRFEWITSIHPYREDAIEELEWAVSNGAKAVKWLPAAMNIDPVSARCDEFYDMLIEHSMPLLTHGGDEHAVDADKLQAFGNPLLFRKALDRGVKVIIAHCASTGTNIDLDKGDNGPKVENINLFARLMNDKNYEGLLFGDTSAVTQVNRTQEALEMIYENDHWHHRLIQGSDYPLPGIMPLISLKSFKKRGYIDEIEADTLFAIRDYNPILFDFLLKRTIRVNGKKLPPQCFESTDIFARPL